jgi:hypothetical protein
MQIHEHIAHHVRKHKEKIIAHVKKHHSKYLVWAWVLSWMAIYKMVWMMALFFGMTYLGWWTIGADYYDAEYYSEEAASIVNISTNTWCDNSMTDDTLSWWNNCPIVDK